MRHGKIVTQHKRKSFADQRKSSAERHGKLKSWESRFFAELAKNSQLCVTCQFSIFSDNCVVT
jgi:hypothetical protein